MIREATAEDLPRIVELLQQMSLGAERRERDPTDAVYRLAFEELRADPRQRLLVLEEEGRVLATATLMFLPNLSHGGRPVAQLESVVVDEACRGRRLGERLVRHCLEEARRAGCFRMQLTSNSARRDAHRFYERLGFAMSHVGFKLSL